jgi:microsomal dipeptidase-like Zn-dependent dipeptidase
MIIDLSESNEKTIKDVLELTKSPVIFSHSNSYSLCESKGNIKDEVFEGIKKNGGVVFITFNPVQLNSKINEKYKILYDEVFQNRSIIENEIEGLKEVNERLDKWIIESENQVNMSVIIKNIQYLKNKIGKVLYNARN